ncbi:hypothetical protein UY3_12989 [Chelonia mydas]|uniref:Uncharacterized protein n=1 Tax=Chelonia mydas TaxID=8469 RepID=M7AYT6_CHEMY|nr:hypothetical protein UY3_12989 [Chelonia mydas]
MTEHLKIEHDILNRELSAMPASTGGHFLPVCRTDTYRPTFTSATLAQSHEVDLKNQWEFDWVLGSALSTEPTVVDDDLVSWDGALLAPESRMETDGTQQQAPSEDSEVMLLLKLVLKEALEQKQQQRILGPYLEELFDAHHEELSTVERVAVTEGTEASHEPGPSTSTGCSTSTARPHCSGSLAQLTFMDHFKRKRFHDEFMVEVLDRAHKMVQYQERGTCS